MSTTPEDEKFHAFKAMVKRWGEKRPNEDDQQRMAAGIVRFLEITEKARALPDRELAAQVIDLVWGKCVNLGSWEEVILDEMITRFEKQAEIERDEEGKVLPEKPPRNPRCDDPPPPPPPPPPMRPNP